jgi:hypothetical protein
VMTCGGPRFVCCYHAVGPCNITNRLLLCLQDDYGVFKSAAVEELKSAMRILRVDSRKAMDALYQINGMELLEKEQRELYIKEREKELTDNLLITVDGKTLTVDSNSNNNSEEESKPSVAVEESKGSDLPPLSVPKPVAHKHRVPLLTEDEIREIENSVRSPQPAQDGMSSNAARKSTKSSADSNKVVLGNNEEVGLDLGSIESKSSSPTSNTISSNFTSNGSIASTPSTSTLLTTFDSTNSVGKESHTGASSEGVRGHNHQALSEPATVGLCQPKPVLALNPFGAHSFGTGSNPPSIQKPTASSSSAATSSLHLHIRTPTPLIADLNSAMPSPSTSGSNQITVVYDPPFADSEADNPATAATTTRSSADDGVVYRLVSSSIDNPLSPIAPPSSPMTPSLDFARQSTPTVLLGGGDNTGISEMMTSTKHIVPRYGGQGLPPGAKKYASVIAAGLSSKKVTVSDIIIPDPAGTTTGNSSGSISIMANAGVPNCPFSPAQLESYFKATDQTVGHSHFQNPNNFTYYPRFGEHSSNKLKVPESPSSASLGLLAAATDAQDIRRKMDFKVSEKYNTSDSNRSGKGSSSKASMKKSDCGSSSASRKDEPTRRKRAASSDPLQSLGPSLMLGATMDSSPSPVKSKRASSDDSNMRSSKDKKNFPAVRRQASDPTAAGDGIARTSCKRSPQVGDRDVANGTTIFDDPGKNGSSNGSTSGKGTTGNRVHALAVLGDL